MGWRWELPRPRFADSVLEERASLLGLILTITAVLLFVTFGIGLVVATDRMVALAIYGPITLVLMVSVALFVRGHMAASAGLLCAFLSLVVMVVVLLTGSPLRTYSGGFVPLMLLARGLLGRRVALVALCIYLAFLIGVSAAYLSGHYPPQLIPVEPVDVMLAGMMYLLFSAAFAFARTRTLEDAVTRARQATETERRLGAQAQALATLGSDALKSASDRVVDDALATILTLPGVSRAAVLTLDGKRWTVTTRGVDEVWARRVETHPDDVLAGRMGLGGEGLVESRSELGQKDGRVGVLLVGFADQAAATAAASFVDTVASLLSSAIDRERRESDLLRSQKRDAAGRLAANVTHDVNNLLASIAADAWTLGQTTTGPAKEIAEQVLQATRRGALLTGRLRMLSGNTSPKPERLSIDRALAELVEELRRRHVPELEVELAIGPGQHVAELDRGDLDQDPPGAHQRHAPGHATGRSPALRAGQRARRGRDPPDREGRRRRHVRGHARACSSRSSRRAPTPPASVWC
ncbi:MAG: hypothetical protein U1F43_21375 [Myxococcota bacterium]